MLSVRENERLTKVGPGTPMGELMRRYWQPIAPSAELDGENPTKEVRLLGEDLVLYRDTSGKLGLIEPSCAHRKANMFYGVPEPNGIRCMYHGWVYDETGQCVDQPSEPEHSRFKEKVRLKAYPTQEMGGLIFAYMGPEPVPILPKWDCLMWENVTREIYYCMLPCNWLQCQENSLDPVHFEWLHHYWGNWTIGRSDPGRLETFRRQTLPRGRHQTKVAFDRFEYGIIKRRLIAGDSEEDEWWRIGHPILFPNVLRVGEASPTDVGRWHAFQYRIPVDDTHTMHMVYRVFVPPVDVTVPTQDTIPWSERPTFDEHGRPRADWVVGQDQSSWIAQGPISARDTERLAMTDVGIIMFRKMLEEQMKVAEDGGDPINVHRVDKGIISLPQEHSYYPGYTETGGPFKDLPIPKPEVVAVLSDDPGVKI